MKLLPSDLIHRQPLLLLAVGVVIGILLDATLASSLSFWITITVLLGCVLFAMLLGGKRRNAGERGTPRRGRILLMVALFFAIGGLRHKITTSEYETATILSFIDDEPRPGIVEGIIDRPTVLRPHPAEQYERRPGQSEWQMQIEVDLRRVKSGHQWTRADGRLLVMLDGRSDELRPGDAIRVYGSIRRFSKPTNPGQRDLRKNFRRRGLHGRIETESVEHVVLLESTATVEFVRPIALIAAKARELLLRYTGEESGPLAIALVIGQRDFVDRNLRDLLLVTGTAHLLSVSGLHLAIIVALAHWMAILMRFPWRGRIVWILAVCILYTAITGGRPPVVRAAVLVATFSLAVLVRRPSQPMNTLALAGLILILWNPSLVFGIGVQLSFLAVATLLLCHQRSGVTSLAVEQTIRNEERLQSLVENSHSRPLAWSRWVAGKLWQLTWFSCCVTATSIPLVWHEFHVVSPISVVTNVILGLFLFPALASGVATVILGSIPPLGYLFGGCCDLLLRGVRVIVELAASVPFGHFWLPAPPTWWIGVFYVVLVATLYGGSKKSVSIFRRSWIFAWCAVAWLLAAQPAALQEGAVEATFIDVGHGTSVVLRFDVDDVWLYDCGRLGNFNGNSRDIDATLWSLGVTRLQGIFLSHADVDHFNSMPGILDRFGVDQIVTPPGMLDREEPAVMALRAVIRSHGIRVREMFDGEAFRRAGHAIDVLHPPAQPLRASDNANSLVLQIDCGGTPLVLPGDLEPPGTDALIDHARPPPGGVLMAPHHGSLRMDARSVLQWSRPAETIVSGGRRARQPEVYEMLSATGSGVHVTNHVGAIRVQIDLTGKTDVRSWTSEPW